MKKIVLAITLSAMILFCGCASETVTSGAPGVYRVFDFSDMSSTEIIKALTKRVQNNIDTHTFEGFTGHSTFGEVLEKTEKDKILYAQLKYIDEILGYPAEMICDFRYNGKDGLSLKRLDFFVLRSGEQAEHDSAMNILNMLDAEFGSHEQNIDGFGFHEYIWKKNGSIVEFYEIGGESNSLAHISLYTPSVFSGKLPEVSDIFPYQLGEDISTIYQNETPDIISEKYKLISASI